MKTAISLPDHAAQRFDEVAQRHGMTRSEFYRRAAEHYADELTDADLTQRIDDAIDATGEPDDEAAVFRRAANARVLEASGQSSDREW